MKERHEGRRVWLGDTSATVCLFLPWSSGAGTAQNPNPGVISSWSKTLGVSGHFSCPMGRWPMGLFTHLFGKKGA